MQPLHPTFLLSRDHTLAIKGFSATLIMILQFIMQIEGYPRVFNIPAGPCVAAFLFISGFGLNESWKVHNGEHYWQRRVQTVLIPYWLVMLFQMPFHNTFDPQRLLHNLLILGSDLWFIDYLFRWYAVYWLAKRFLPRYVTVILTLFGLYCTTLDGLMSGQSFTFLAGYLASEHYSKVKSLTRSRIINLSVMLLGYGVLALALKELPMMRDDKSSWLFHLDLAGLQLSLGLCLIGVSSLMPRLCRLPLIRWTGKISYELYIVHYNFMPFVANHVGRIFLYLFSSLGISHIFNRFNALIHKEKAWMLCIGMICYAGINYMFACKYAMRVTDHFGPVIMAYLMFITLLMIFMLSNKEGLLQRVNKLNASLFFILCIVALLVVQYHFDPMQNHVDRWSALAYPIRNLLYGEFPYLANTHLGGKASPFPVWQIVHIPFYLLGNVGLSEIVAVVCYVISIRCLYGLQKSVIALIMVMLSLAIIYEVSVRSDLIANFLLLNAFINWMIILKVRLRVYGVAVAVACGLWLSTRLTTALPMFIFFMPTWMQLSAGKKVAFPIVATLTLVATFLPFYIWNKEALLFDETSPFTLQTRQGGSSDIIITLFAMLVMVCVYIRRKQSLQVLYLYSALSLIILSVASFTRRMIEDNSWRLLFESRYDITYFNAALPFLITYICLCAKDSGTCSRAGRHVSSSHEFVRSDGLLGRA